MSSSIGRRNRKQQSRDCRTTLGCSALCPIAHHFPSRQTCAVKSADSCSTALPTTKSWPVQRPSSCRTTESRESNMGLEYSAVQWNRQKRIYDFVLAGGVGAFL